MMRYKGRPVKSSRSVTFIIDGQTSFGDNNGTQQAPNNRKPTQPIVPSVTQGNTSHQNHHNHNQTHNQHRTTSHTSAEFQHAFASGSHYPGVAISSRNHDEYPQHQHSRSLLAHQNDAEDDSRPPMRKQFEHNFRHMSDVMRLAFLENNDISIEDYSNIDFNSMSTASILQRNIQQQLQHQLRHQQLLDQQQRQQRQQQQQYQHGSIAYGDHAVDFDDEDIEDEDYEITDSRIFATAAPSSSNGGIAFAQPRRIPNKKLSRSTVQVPKDDVPIESLPRNGDSFLCDEPDCGKSFPSLRKLRHHKVVHSDEFPFVCEFRGCSKKFKRKFGIDLHSTTHFDLDPEMYSKSSNSSSLPFFGRRMQYSMCRPCGQKFKTVHEYQYHMLKHGKAPFKCPVKGCDQTFGIWKSFQKHRASHYFNYYCKMDPKCDHHTSNLQLLKLHIYCCHFRRKLPENATVASRDREDTAEEDESTKDDQIGLDDSEDISQQTDGSRVKLEESVNQEDDMEAEDLSPPPPPVMTTPRRDSRLRKNPPRSSTFGHQDYASVNNGASFAKSISATPQTVKKTRASLPSSGPQSSVTIEKRMSLEYDDDEELDLSDSKIFETASPILNQHKDDPSFVSPKTSLSRSTGKTITDNSMNSNKKRCRESIQSAGTSNNSSFESVKKYDEGFLCDEPDCGKSFPSLRKLRHHKVVHSDEFPFVCEFRGCSKKFKRKFGIDLHSTTHFDLDPEMYSKSSNSSSLPFFGRRMQYSMCRPCGQKFKTVHEYQYHMLKHGKAPFKCPVKGCDQTFGIWKSFQKHRASHYFNYYCKMDPKCDHHTSNLQLLKLHIYCCHFRRKLPENATVASRDREDTAEEDESTKDDQIGLDDSEDISQQTDGSRVKLEESVNQEDDMEAEDLSPPPPPVMTTPRRDSRLRKNPPRSSTFSRT